VIYVGENVAVVASDMIFIQSSETLTVSFVGIMCRDNHDIIREGSETDKGHTRTQECHAKYGNMKSLMKICREGNTE
jgi:hypothetical protein